MENSNSLINLQNILDIAIKSGDTSASISKVLIDAMKQSSFIKSPTAFDFYKIITYAEHEIKCLDDSSTYLDCIYDLQKIFTSLNINGEPWSMVLNNLKASNVIVILHLLGSKIHDRNPCVYFEKDLLDTIRQQFDSISEEVKTSNLSPELRRF
jgi:hypothetical protein